MLVVILFFRGFVCIVFFFRFLDSWYSKFIVEFVLFGMEGGRGVL